ncbi:MAG TPA: ABC transporter substrate-binding protein [Acidobacteriota bacterium]
MKKLRAAFAILLLSALAILRVAPTNIVSEHGHSRIVSLAPNLTEIAFELGAGKQIVGVTTYCTYPPEAQKKEKIGDFINPNIEKIVALNPDLVVAERWTSSKIVPHLRGMGINVVETLSPKSLAEIYQVIREVGTAVGRADRAEALVRKMQERVRAIADRGKRFPRHPTVYVEIDLPSWTVGRASFISEAVSLCGARNIFDDVERPALQVSRETVIERDPEIIISFDASVSEFHKRGGWEQIRAVRNEKIIADLDRNLLSHGNHRLVDGMEKLQARLEAIVTK